jgi:hypothetical protein
VEILRFLLQDYSAQLAASQYVLVGSAKEFLGREAFPANPSPLGEPLLPLVGTCHLEHSYMHQHLLNSNAILVIITSLRPVWSHTISGRMPTQHTNVLALQTEIGTYT